MEERYREMQCVAGRDQELRIVNSLKTVERGKTWILSGKLPERDTACQSLTSAHFCCLSH